MPVRSEQSSLHSDNTACDFSSTSKSRTGPRALWLWLSGTTHARSQHSSVLRGTPGGPSPAAGAAAPSCLSLLSVTQYRCNTGACILQGKEHQKFCSLKFSQFPFSKRVNKSSKTGIVSPFHSQACVSVFLSPKIKHKPKTNVPPTPNPRRPSSRDSS